MKHNQNLKGRIIYIIVLYFLFAVTFKLLNIKINITFYGMFLGLYLGYYIFDILNFSDEYRLKDFVYSSFLNGIVFYILVIFDRKIDIVIGYLGFTIIQNIIRYLLTKIFRHRYRVMILGDGVVGQKIEKLILRNSSFEYVGFVDDKNPNSIGKIKDLEKIAEKENINELVYVTSIMDKDLEERILKIKLSGVKIMDSHTFLEHAEGNVDVETLTMEWIIKSPGFNILNSSLQQRIKRLFDISLGSGLFLCTFPLMIITYILVKLDNPKDFFSNPAFFKQKRIGVGGEEFEIIKFRSMRLHDPEKFSKYASEKDNRITSIGKFIRKTRLDELPQLINVLKGEMSFIGPRPEWNELGREYEEKINLYKLRYAVKPGITGWAQVMYPYGANLEDTKRKLEYDIYYIKQQSFILDIIIFFKTIKTVLFGKGM